MLEELKEDNLTPEERFARMDDELRQFIAAVWLCLEEKQFANWTGRKTSEYLHECGPAGGTPDGFWEWLDKAEAYRVRAKIHGDEAEYLQERIEFARPYLSNLDEPMVEVLGRALGVSPDRALAEYDRRRTEGTLPTTPKH